MRRILNKILNRFGLALLPYDSFVVIYDEVDPETADECVETFYEMFSSPEEAMKVFDPWFERNVFNPRLALVLGPTTSFRTPDK